MQVTEDGRHMYGMVDCGESSSGKNDNNDDVLGMSGAHAEIFMSRGFSLVCGPCGDGSGSMYRPGSRRVL